MREVYLAIINVFKERNYFLAFVLIAMVFFALFIFIPVFTIPGNDLGFQLSIYSQKDYVLMFLLAALVGLNLALQVYIFRKQREERRLTQSTGQLAVSGISGVFGAVVGTAACASCLAFFFGLIGLGAGSVIFVLNNQIYFFVGAIILLLISLYFTARKVNGVCESCHIDKAKT
ncbi:MAG: hypothetical protein HYT07_01280 [Candidatus Levybacteria bacterium]|nr:hypothetical protein [Candidatus Levybacteria bacterium]